MAQKNVAFIKPLRAFFTQPREESPQGLDERRLVGSR